MATRGAVDGAAFDVYAERAPALRPGQIVVLDNLSAPKSEAARTAIETANCRRPFLSDYPLTSTRLNKGLCQDQGATARRRGAHLRRTLFKATDAAIAAASAADACGFPLPVD